VFYIILNITFVLDVEAGKKTKGEVAFLEEQFEELDIVGGPLDTRPPLASIPSKIEPGFFYRVFDDEEGQLQIRGVYAKKANYYNQELFSNTQDMKSFVFTQDTSVYKNFLGVVFFGIWSFQEEDKENKTIEMVEIPVRKVNENAMFYKTDAEQYKYYPRIIWRTGGGPEETKSESARRYSVVPCKSRHTEPVFSEFIRHTNNQTALWNYFLKKSSAVQAEQKKLDVIGFKFYSSLDSCDGCFEALFDLHTNYETALSSLPPSQFQPETRMPFLTLFHAKSFYHLQYDKVFGSSLYFYPINIKPLIRLSKKEDGVDSHNCYVHDTQAAGGINTDVVNHFENIKFKEMQKAQFIILKIDDAQEIKVTLH
jgi:hypothetical protein